MNDLDAGVSLRKDRLSCAGSSSRGVRAASRVASFTESVIREMTRPSDEHAAINLAQGFPNFPAPVELKDAAVAAIRADVNQYPITCGARDLREAIAASYERRGWPSVDPASEVTVTCGSTEAVTTGFLSLTDPGDEIVLLEPMSCARPSPRARARSSINTPRNPSGKVFGAADLSFGPEFCARLADHLARWDLLVAALRSAGFPVSVPEGAHYGMADINAHGLAIGAADDTAFCRRLVEQAAVAAVPGSSLYRRPADGGPCARFAFPKRRETLEAAGERLVAFGRRLGLA